MALRRAFGKVAGSAGGITEVTTAADGVVEETTNGEMEGEIKPMKMDGVEAMKTTIKVDGVEVMETTIKVDGVAVGMGVDGDRTKVMREAIGDLAVECMASFQALTLPHLIAPPLPHQHPTVLTVATTKVSLYVERSSTASPVRKKIPPNALTPKRL